jgi:shikimate kinase
MPLWLIGMMGSGKSLVGAELAASRRVPFLDTDEMVEAVSGMSVEEIFENEGEAGFRQRESEAVLVAAAAGNAVVATGGGVVTVPANVAAMRASGTIVWLKASVATLAERLNQHINRPLLAGLDKQVALARLLEERFEAYSAAADFSIETDRLESSETVRLVEAMWTA